MKNIKTFESFLSLVDKNKKEEPSTWLAYTRKSNNKIRSWVDSGRFEEFETEDEVDKILDDIKNTGTYKGIDVDSAHKWTAKRVEEIRKIRNQGQ